MFEIFGISDATNLEELKMRLIDTGRVPPSFAKKISKMTEAQLKDFVFFRRFDEKPWEGGVAPIFTAVAQKDVRKMIKHILGIELPPQNIIRVMIDTLANLDVYKDREDHTLYRHLYVFKIKYEAGFKRLLFTLGQIPNFDRLDLIRVFVALMK